MVAPVAILVLIGALLPLMASMVPPSSATGLRRPLRCPAGGCSVTIDARDFPSGTPLANFNYIINLDNTKLPNDPKALNTESNSPIVREGDQTRNTVTLCRPGAT